jgi:3-oxoacyl-[acyl-carrier protein] reductase
VGSIASYEAAGSVSYNTVKAGLAAYVRTLGRELAGDGIIATGVLPGGFIAPGNAMDRLKTNKPDVYEKFIADRLPRKKMGEAEEIVPLLTLLCSEGASMMSGCLVPIDAGEGKAYLAD